MGDNRVTISPMQTLSFLDSCQFSPLFWGIGQSNFNTSVINSKGQILVYWKYGLHLYVSLCTVHEIPVRKDQ